MISRGCPTTTSKVALFRIFERLWHFSKHLYRRWGEWNEMKRHHRQLLKLDDRLLKDIGLSRADAFRITHGHNFWLFMFRPEEYERTKQVNPRRGNDL